MRVKKRMIEYPVCGRLELIGVPAGTAPGTKPEIPYQGTCSCGLFAGYKYRRERKEERGGLLVDFPTGITVALRYDRTPRGNSNRYFYFQRRRRIVFRMRARIARIKRCLANACEASIKLS